MTDTQYALFLDAETTGLDPLVEHFMEIAFVLVDTQTWQPVKQTSSLVFTRPLYYRLKQDTLSPFIKKMHTESGLLEEIMQVFDESTDTSTFPTYADYAQSIINRLNEWGVEKKTPIWGSSVHFDRKWIAAKMPLLDEFLHYRVVDSSSDMERLKLRFPELWEQIDNDPTKYVTAEPGHRALVDIMHSIDLERRLEKWVTRPAASLISLGQA